MLILYNDKIYKDKPTATKPRYIKTIKKIKTVINNEETSTAQLDVINTNKTDPRLSYEKN